MRKLIWTNTFIRSFKKIKRKRPESLLVVESTLRILLDEPFESSINTHKLKGKLSGAWACSAGYDLRIVFDFVENGDILLIDLGTHDEVY